MIGKGAENDILRLFGNNPKTSFTINQIAIKLKKPYPFIHNKVKQLLQEHILNKKQIGHAHLCSLNLNDDKTIALLSLIAAKQKENYLKNKEDLNKILQTLLSIKEKISLQLILCTENTIYVVVENPNQGFIPVDTKDQAMLFLSVKQLKKQIISEPKVIDEFNVLFGFEKYYQTLNEIKREI